MIYDRVNHQHRVKENLPILIKSRRRLFHVEISRETLTMLVAKLLLSDQ